MNKNYQKRDPKEYNVFRAIFQWITCNLVYGLYYRIVYNLKIEGRENIPKKGMYIIASNHVSAIDPFLVIHATQRPIAYMAKIELFQKKIMRFFLDLLGAFAVDRAKVSPSTIKTILGLRKTNWCFGIFPQGTRDTSGNIENINKGFVSFAKSLKCEIIPIAITGMAKDQRKAFNSNMKIKIGKPISSDGEIEEVVKNWSNKIIELSEGRR